MMAKQVQRTVRLFTAGYYDDRGRWPTAEEVYQSCLSLRHCPDRNTFTQSIRIMDGVDIERNKTGMNRKVRLEE